MRTSASHRTAPWLVPSATDLIFILLLTAMTWGILAPKLLGDADVGWHIRNGELMLQTHHITRVDVFSATISSAGRIESGKPWYAWEWLYDLGVGAIHRWRGLNAVVFAAALVISFTFALAFRLTLSRGANVIVAALFFLFAFGASSVHLFARPHIVSWLLTLVWFHILDSAELYANRRARLLWLPLLMLIWVNLHGGFVLGFVLLALYLAAAAYRYFISRDERTQTSIWIKKLAAVTVLSLLVSLANPYGYRLHLHVYRYLSDTWLMNHIDEFQSPNFHGLPQQCFTVLLLLTVAALTSRRDPVRISQGLVVVFAGYSGLYAARNLPIASILLMMIAAPVLSRTIVSAATGTELPRGTRSILTRVASFGSRMGSLEFNLRGHLWPIVFVLLGLFVCINCGRLGSHPLMNAQFDSKRFPVEAVKSLPQGTGELIMAPDSWGGYLIYQIYPRFRVYVDDRHDFYGAAFLKDYLKILRFTPEWKDRLNDTRVRLVLIPSDSSLASGLRESPDWKLVHEDKTAVLFEKR